MYKRKTTIKKQHYERQWDTPRSGAKISCLFRTTIHGLGTKKIGHSALAVAPERRGSLNSWLTAMTGSNLAARAWWRWQQTELGQQGLYLMELICAVQLKVDGECLDERQGTVQWFTVQWEAVLHIRQTFLSFQHEHVVGGEAQHVFMQSKKHWYALKDKKTKTI